MVQCKTVLSVIGFIILLFFGIPIRVNPPATAQNNTISLFDNFIDKFNKTYKNNETLRQKKFATFQATLQDIEELNLLREHNMSARFGVTKFSDMTKDEFIQKYLLSDMYLRIKNNTYINKKSDHSKEDKDSLEVNMVKRSILNIPKKVDWRKNNVVNKVNNQRNCGACWAFSTLETIESMRAIKHGILEKLSVQQMIDCAGYNNDGCNGGDICTLLFWLVNNDIKINKEEEYPLHLKTETCKLNNPLGVEVDDFKCNSFIDDEDSLLYSLANHGPVAVAINAMLWQNYLGGVIHFHCDGSPSLLNHAVQIVGYDTTAEIPHYIVRNSWGTDFGDHGYLYIAIGSNVCGLANEVVSLDVV